MAVFRVKKDTDNPYLVINKSFIYDSRLSLKAKGLMSYFLSRPDDWEFYSYEISKHCTDKKDALSRAIKELVRCGYIQRNHKRDSNGKLMGGYDYIIYETPQQAVKNEVLEDTTESGFSEIGKNRNRKKPNSENPPLLNNESLLNNETTTTGSSDNGCKDVFKKFEMCGFGLLSPIIIEKIIADVQQYGKDWVMEAAEIAALASKRRYDYVKGILENWERNGKTEKKAKDKEKLEPKRPEIPFI
jgi:DnaD/phage-associated family protein